MSKYYVFLDTEVFDRNGLNHNTWGLNRIRQAACDGSIQLVTTTLTECEIRCHVQRHSQKVSSDLSTLRKSASGVAAFTDQLDALDENQILSQLTAARDDFLASCKPIVVGLRAVNVADIVEQYFAGKPPFGSGKKKHEFPDAIAAAALLGWCKDNDCHLHVVGNDGDWKSLCQTTTRLTHHHKLSDVLRLVPDPVHAALAEKAILSDRSPIERAIKDNVANRGYFLDEVDSNVRSARAQSIDLIDINVVEADENSAVAEVSCEVRIVADVTYSDPNSWIYDSEDRVAHYMDTVEDEIECTHEIAVVAAVKYRDGDRQNPSYDSVDIADDSDIQLYARDDYF